MNNAAIPGSGLTASGYRSLTWVGGLLASLAASVVAAILAVVFTASLVVIAVMAAALVAFALLAARARRALRGATNPSDPQIIEARNVGGHSWVAYGWDRGN
jgi:cobalamin synthase